MKKADSIAKIDALFASGDFPNQVKDCYEQAKKRTDLEDSFYEELLRTLEKMLSYTEV